MRAYDRGELSTTTKIRVTTAHCFDKLENTVYRNLALQGASRIISAMATTQSSLLALSEWAFRRRLIQYSEWGKGSWDP